MRVDPRLAAYILILIGLAAAGPAQVTAERDDATRDLSELITRLGDDDYTVRDLATRSILALGPDVVEMLRERLTSESDPEIHHRIQFILDNLVVPSHAVMVVRAALDSGLFSGDLITHVNARRVRNSAELRRLLNRDNAPLGAMCRVTGPEGPREIGPLRLTEIESAFDYVAPRGPLISRAVRLYADGFVERAYELLETIPSTIPDNELSPGLLARIAYTAGDAKRALALLAGHADAVQPGTDEWYSPSQLDLLGPGKAPFDLEWRMFSEGPEPAYASRSDPDLRVQRILVPARRYDAALLRAAQLWWTTFRPSIGADNAHTRTAGNQLAVIGWMLSEMGLRSECCRVVEPRSQILRSAPFGLRKWIRVDTDAWLPFFRGDEKAALDGFYVDAMNILQRPPPSDDRNIRIRNPHVAARLAFFLYQLPEDARVAEALRVVNFPSHPVLDEYVDWMLLALHERNQTAIRRDLLAILPNLADAQIARYARDAAMLEYVQDDPDREVLAEARRRIAQSSRSDLWVAIVDAMQLLIDAHADAALRTLSPFRDEPEAAALLSTAEFLSAAPAAAANHRALGDARLAVRAGGSDRYWIILTRRRRLLLFDAQQSLLTAIDKPSEDWFPSPLTWPWIGREPASGRVWAYDRRRIVELTPEREQRMTLGVRSEDVSVFDRVLSRFFSQIADAIAAVPLSAGENGEFRRDEVLEHADYLADPDLPEIAIIQTLERDPRIVHVSLRGGPHLLIDTQSRRAWTSIWVRDQLALDAAPTFFAQAQPPATDAADPVVLLISDHGLIRFDAASETLSRIPLPGDDPFPPLIPESTPYVRQDPRFAYCAKLPHDGGQVYRLTPASGEIEATDMVNQALPEHYFDMRPRAAIRADLDQLLTDAGMPPLQPLIDDAADIVSRWSESR